MEKRKVGNIRTTPLWSTFSRLMCSPAKVAFFFYSSFFLLFSLVVVHTRGMTVIMHGSFFSFHSINTYRKCELLGIGISIEKFSWRKPIPITCSFCTAAKCHTPPFRNLCFFMACKLFSHYLLQHREKIYFHCSILVVSRNNLGTVGG